MKKKKWLIGFLILFLVLGIFLIVIRLKMNDHGAIVFVPEYSFKSFNPDSIGDWDKMSFLSESYEFRELALLNELNALNLKDTEKRRQHITHLLAEDWPNLLHTFWVGSYFSTVAFNPRGDKLLVGKQLYDAITGNQIGETHDVLEVLSADFSRDNRLLLTGNIKYMEVSCLTSEEEIEEEIRYTTRLWTADTMKPIGKILEQKAKILAVSFSPDGKRFYTCSKKQLQTYSTEDQEELHRPLRFKTPVDHAEFNADGSKLFVFSLHKKGVLFNTDTGEREGKAIDFPEEVNSAAFSEGGRFLWIMARGNIQKIEIATGLIQTQKIKQVDAIAVAPTGGLIAFHHSDNNEVQIWDWENKKKITGFPWNIERNISNHSILFSPGGDKIVLCNSRWITRMFHTRPAATATIALEHPNVQKIWFPPAKQEMLSFGDGEFRVWQIDGGNAFLKRKVPVRIEGDIIATSADGLSVLFRRKNGDGVDKAQIWNITAMRPQGGMINEDIETAAFHQKNNTLITGSKEGTLRFYGVTSGKEIKEPLVLGKKIQQMAAIPHSENMLVAYEDSIQIIDYATGKLKVNLPIDNKMRTIIFAPTGDKVLIYDNEAYISQELALWDMKTRKLLAQSGGQCKPDNDYTVTNAGFTPDGTGVVIITSRNFMHRYKISNPHIQMVETRYLGGLCRPGEFRFLHQEGNMLQYVLRESNNSFRLKTLQWNTYKEPPIQGKPQELLDQWQKRLKTRIARDSTIECDFKE